MKEKKFCLKPEDIKELFHWDYPEGCFASDRIIVDGCKVGYMYCEEPDEDSDMPDSGWRFMAGDEDEEYMNNPDNLGIYSLNTLANYDPDIIPFLEAPYGTAFYRDKDGIIKEDHGEDIEIIDVTYRE